jgi:hypothetical protein
MKSAVQPGIWVCHEKLLEVMVIVIETGKQEVLSGLLDC